MNKYTIIILSFVIVIFVLREIFDKKPRTKKEYQYKEKKFFLSAVEHKFYDALVLAVGAEYRIFAQVHLPTIVDHNVGVQSKLGSFRHIDEKSVDFVLCDKAYISPKMVIELDDSTHGRPDRRERDVEVERILKMAGLLLLRVPVQNEFNVGMLQSQIHTALSQHSVGVSPKA